MLEIISRLRLHPERLKTNEAATPREYFDKRQAVHSSMSTIEQKSNSNLYSANNMAKPVNFYCNAPQAISVCLEGDFSGWSSLAMRQRVDGWWFLQVPLTHGHHQYRFLVDGQPLLDPRASGIAHNEANEKVSIVAVS